MEVILMLLPLAIILGALFVAAFLWSVSDGQYDDIETPRHRLLLDETPTPKKDVK